MKVARLVLGIITIVLSGLVLFLAIGASVEEYMLSDYGVNSGAGIMFACFPLLLGEGIVMTACYRKKVLGGCIACTAINVVGVIITLASEAYVIGLFIIFVILGVFGLVGLVLAAVHTEPKLNQ